MVQRDGAGTKEANEAALERSVVDRPTGSVQAGTDIAQLFFNVASFADDIDPWGSLPKRRDRSLREFYPTEPYFSSALGAVCARNAAYSWTLEGSPRLAKQYQDVLENANGGEGWEDLITKVSADLYTQDNSAFIETVRAADSPSAQVIDLVHLDAQHCYHTGDPRAPVVYRDRLNKLHLLKWYQVVTLSEMPTPIEGLYGMQLCALSRVLGSVQIMRNILVYMKEKTGGRFTRAVHLVKGVTTAMLQDALTGGKVSLDQQGLLRYGQPLMVGIPDPEGQLQVATIPLASLPDNFNQEDMMKWYITILALGFLTDYQEFAPLSSGGIGSATQSQILHLKGQVKGAALFRKLVTHTLNKKVLPKALEFRYEVQDIEEEKSEAEVTKTRAEGWKLLKESTELPGSAFVQMAVDAGEIPEEVAQAAGHEDVTPDVKLGDEEQQGQDEAAAAATGKLAEAPGAGPSPAGAKALAERWATGVKASAQPKVVDFLASRIHESFTVAADRLRSLGYMDTEARIALSGLIGDLLKALEKRAGAEITGIVGRNIAQDDLETAMKALTEEVYPEEGFPFRGMSVQQLGGIDWLVRRKDEPARAGPFDEERLKAERRMERLVLRGLRVIQANVERRLRGEYKAGAKARQSGGYAVAFKVRVDADEKFWREQRAVLVRELEAAQGELLRQGARQAVALGLSVDWELVNAAVLRIIPAYTDAWWKMLAKTTRTQLRVAIEANIAAGAPLKSLIRDITPLFGKQRAALIASTEVTRLYTEGNLAAYKASGVQRVEWRTAMDDRVDPLCQALSGKRWKVDEAERPPLHPACRCNLAPIANDEALTRVEPQAARKEAVAV